MWRIGEVLQLMELLPIRHPEKKAKVRLLLDSRKSWSELNAYWAELIVGLESSRIDFIKLAAEECKREQLVSGN